MQAGRGVPAQAGTGEGWQALRRELKPLRAWGPPSAAALCVDIRTSVIFASES